MRIVFLNSSKHIFWFYTSSNITSTTRSETETDFYDVNQGTFKDSDWTLGSDLWCGPFWTHSNILFKTNLSRMRCSWRVEKGERLLALQAPQNWKSVTQWVCVSLHTDLGVSSIGLWPWDRRVALVKYPVLTNHINLINDWKNERIENMYEWLNFPTTTGEVY